MAENNIFMVVLNVGYFNTAADKLKKDLDLTVTIHGSVNGPMIFMVIVRFVSAIRAGAIPFDCSEPCNAGIAG
jgi:hypothetical protein